MNILLKFKAKIQVFSIITRRTTLSSSWDTLEENLSITTIRCYVAIAIDDKKEEA